MQADARTRKKEASSPQRLQKERTQPSWHLDFRIHPPELQGNRCVWFSVAKPVVISYGSNRKILQVSS
jgi:hypothetical protein